MNKTQTGTVVVNGIEYNEYPPPRRFVKVMARQWAEELVQYGRIRLQKLEYYRRWENDLLGDPNDGLGLYHLEKHPIQTGSANDVYAWCLSLPEICPDRLLTIAEKGQYDCKIFICSPEKLFERIHAQLQDCYKGFRLHCGRVNYDRGAAVDKKALDSQKFHFNVFQKGTRFQEDKEYRLSITNCTFRKREEDHMDLVLGKCDDLVSIHPLQKTTMGANCPVTVRILGRFARTFAQSINGKRFSSQ